MILTVSKLEIRKIKRKSSTNYNFSTFISVKNFVQIEFSFIISKTIKLCIHTK